MWAGDRSEPQTTQTSMDEAIDRWRRALMKGSVTAEEILGIYEQAKHLDQSLNR